MKTKLIRGFLLTAIYINLIIIYYNQISTVFSYEGFGFKNPNLSYVIIANLFIFILIMATFFMKNSFYLLIYSIYITMFIFGQTVYDIFNGTNLVGFLYLPAIFIFLLDQFDKSLYLKRKTINLNYKYFNIIALFLATLLITPYLKNISTININNLLLVDIYKTREEVSGNQNLILAYLFSFISRIIFPFLFIYFITIKKYILASYLFILTILMFLLNGAVKSILFGLLCCLFFYFFKYKYKNLLYLIFLFVMTSLSILMKIIFNNITITDYLRRLFFTPANLFNVYHSYFSNSYTYFLHSRLAKLFNVNTIDGSLPLYIGEKVMGKEGLVANVGIFVEGYFSFGIFGVLFASLLFILIIWYLNKLNLSHRYFGIIFAYIYIINTSFVETLLITHGLIFLLIFGYFLIPKNET